MCIEYNFLLSASQQVYYSFNCHCSADVLLTLSRPPAAPPTDAQRCDHNVLLLRIGVGLLIAKGAWVNKEGGGIGPPVDQLSRVLDEAFRRVVVLEDEAAEVLATSLGHLSLAHEAANDKESVAVGHHSCSSQVEQEALQSGNCGDCIGMRRPSLYKILSESLTYRLSSRSSS